MRSLFEALWETFSGLIILVTVLFGVALGFVVMWYVINAYAYGWIVDMFIFLAIFSSQDFMSNYRKAKQRNKPR